MNKLTKTLVLALTLSATALTSITPASAGEWVHNNGGYREGGYHNRGHHNGGYYNGGYRNGGYHRKEHHSKGGISGKDAVTLGIIGLAIGVTAAAIMSDHGPRHRGGILEGPVNDPRFQRRGGYYRYTNQRYQYPVDVGHNMAKRGSLQWLDYCTRRFRTFNPRTGTYRGYDGKNHYCVAR